MGEQQVDESLDKEQIRLFVEALLRDVRALEKILDSGLIESDVRRIGAEQELFLVDENWHPAPRALELLEALEDPSFTTELALFNLEFNLEPLELGGDCLSLLHKQMDQKLSHVRQIAKERNLEVVLTGILPTLTKSDLDMENMTPRPRYFALNKAMSRLRGEDYELSVKGTDELILRHDSVMLESCNTSVQFHFQVTPAEFARMYNTAQLITAPLLAASTNSPLLFGKRLWRETRIALFQQAVDTRRASPDLREARARVRFGDDWVRESILEIFQEDISRFRVLLGAPSDEDPFEMLEQDKPPELKALRLHNSTIYRWNRPCYGIWDGKAHLRIENRVLPAGPTIVDSVANAAFLFGLISGVSSQFQDVSKKISFEKVQTNFMAAARFGLGAQFNWIGLGNLPAQELICKHLIPVAEEGLIDQGVDEAEARHYLGILAERVKTGQTGSEWTLQSLAKMDEELKGERFTALTAATAARQKRGIPVHEWDLGRIEEGGGWKPGYQRVEQFMTTDLYTVSQHDSVSLVSDMMHWQRIRHVPVEDERQRLIGLISYRSLLRYVGERPEKETAISVTDIMKPDPITVTPDTSALKAVKLMRQKRIGCLPVVKDQTLVGIITEHDFMQIARELLERTLAEAGQE